MFYNNEQISSKRYDIVVIDIIILHNNTLKLQAFDFITKKFLDIY